jgi:DNA-directed RNA polymerase subunit alpha
MPSNEIMYINWRDLIKPDKVQVTSTPSYGKFVCEPLERGFGTTIGNSLRRIILSSLYGAAIVSVKFDSVMHEFSAIPGVLEDVSEIILNLKEVRLKADGIEPRTIRLEAKGEGDVVAGAILSEDGKVEILNPDLHIATLSEEGVLNMTMNVKVDKGYSLAEANKDEDAAIGTIPIDAVFSPIKRVNYVVGNARVGQKNRLRQAHPRSLDRWQYSARRRCGLCRQNLENADVDFH